MTNNFKIPDMLLGNDINQYKKYTKFIIDTDAGGDDAHAIMMASYILKYIRKDAELLGITCVSGNASLYNVIKNVYITSRYCHFDEFPKIYKGCEFDSMRKFHRDFFFKEDGFGGVQNQYLKELNVNENQQLYENQHAVDFLKESIEKYQEELCIICIGPLTNIYITLLQHPQIINQLGCLFCMCGTYMGIGNQLNGIAEFNIATDVLATKMVLQADFKNKIILPFDTVLSYSLNKDVGSKIFNVQYNKIAKLIHDIYENVVFETCYYLCDELAIVMAMMPETITQALLRGIHIVEDGFARGGMIVDWIKKMKKEDTSQVAIVTQFNWDQMVGLALKTNQE
ncbi:unnamed protein product [Paramecium pentaurelia]|uniref:Inosine/uridine-preferring nucleoside hydrolase domain-containing protein n=1 Tax=Paramecium pentaurelia TaxID=43138 RepID=A0A8S1V8B6_9CILI|nr:unnamed protein product [Paramecium pentaurelia]